MYGVLILDRDTRVRGFQEKPTRDEARSDLANCGVYVIEPELLERIPADALHGLRPGPLADARRGRRADLRVHDDGVLERRRRPRRAAQRDPRRRARERAGRDPRRGDLARGSGPRTAAESAPTRRWTARSCSAATSSSRTGAQIRGPAVIGADCRVGPRGRDPPRRAPAGLDHPGRGPRDRRASSATPRQLAESASCATPPLAPERLAPSQRADFLFRTGPEACYPGRP